MNSKLTALAVSLLTTLVASAQEPNAQEPDAKKILEGARMAATLTKLNDGLTGTVRKGGVKIPVTLFLKGKDIQFQFKEAPEQPLRIFHMRLGDEAFNLFEIIDGKTVNFPAAKLATPIGNTDLTYEDLALRFFYWPNPKLDGKEDVAGQSCYKIRVDKPKGVAGRYEVVYVWIHTKFGAFMQIKAYDKKGGLVKEFQVQDVMQIDKDVWTLSKMQVATDDPATGRKVSITDVTFDSPKKAEPHALH